MSAHDLLVVDRSALFREGLSLLLENSLFHVAAQATSLREAEKIIIGKSPPSIVLVEWPADDGVYLHKDAMAHLERICAQAPTVVMSDVLCQERVRNALSAGARGFLLKDISSKILSHYLLLVLLGETVLPSRVAQALLEERGPQLSQEKALNQLPHNLREREKQILLRLLYGDSNKSIARRLHMSENAVKVQLKSILRKISVRNRTQAAVWAMSQGITPKDLEAAFESAQWGERDGTASLGGAELHIL